MRDHGPFPQQSSTLDLRLGPFQTNKAAWEDVSERFEEALRATSVQGSSNSLSTHQARGQLLGMCAPGPTAESVNYEYII